MPKDGESSTQGKVPLKRGDACLYCRKRRIKCSAEKPSCSQCHGKRECIYDNGKPVSRVRQLEDKVAQLEAMLQQTSSRRTSEDNSPQGHLKRMTSDPQSNSSNPRSTPGSFDVNMQQDPPQASTSGFSFEGTGMDDMNMFDINAIQQSFSEATSGLSNDFFSFGGSMFGEPSQQPTIPTLSNPLQDATTMFDFSTLDPNFMSLVNSFDSTFQSNQAASTSQVQPTSQPTPAQPSIFAATVTEDTSTGFTPYLNPDYSPPSTGPPPIASTSTGYPLSRNDAAAPTPGRHFSHLAQTVSYNAGRDSQIPQAHPDQPSWKIGTGQSSISTGSSPHPSISKDGIYMGGDADDPVVAQVLGDKSPEGLDSYASQATASFSAAFQKPADSRAGLGAEFDQQGFELVGGWFDANDLPRVARDHLLDLFFSGMRMFAQIFHVPRFFASLTLPPSRRPHPCLLYSMYLLASRISSSPSIRALEAHFANIASRQLEESIAKADRLFDATRAATILSTYKYSNARYHEGWMMIGLAARLGVSCGLHQIPSSVWKPNMFPRDRTADLVALVRQRTFVLPPPADAVELGERIGAFWCIFMTERCGTISAQWPPSIHDDVITTPYPKPLHEYELGLVSADDDQSISTLYDPSPPQQTLPHYAAASDQILRLRALAILERASKLIYLRPEPEFEQMLREQSQATSPSGPIDEYLFFQNISMYHGPDFLGKENGADPVSASASSQGKTWMRCPKVRTPKAYAEVKLALEKIEIDLPPERRTDWTVWDGRVQQWHFNASKMDNYSLHFIVGVAWMFLFDVAAFGAENTASVKVARRLTQTIRAMKMNVAGLGGDFDVFIAMTWSFISKILIREVKRLQALGDLTGAAEIELDVEVIIQALKTFGQRYNIAGVQALRAERYRQSTVDEVRDMERAHEEEQKERSAY